MKEAFEKMTGMPDAWTNPALMVSRNAFIQGWEARTQHDVDATIIQYHEAIIKRLEKRIEDLAQPAYVQQEYERVIYQCPRCATSMQVDLTAAALAQPAQEPVQWSAYEYDGIHHKPVAWMDRDGNFSDNNDYKCFPIPLYTITHPQRPWVGLTFAEICDAEVVATDGFNKFSEVKFARAIEAKLKALNT